jgi:hypothetical protein
MAMEVRWPAQATTQLAGREALGQVMTHWWRADQPRWAQTTPASKISVSLEVLLNCARKLVGGAVLMM